MSRFVGCWILVLCCVFHSCSAQETCYPPGGVAGIVVATIVVTVVVGGLATALGWRFWNRKHGVRTCGQERRGPEATPTSKGLSTEFAFDNPYFRDQENDQDTEKGKMRSSINNKNSLRSSKVSDFSSNKTKKSRSGKNPFTFSGGASKKQRALDDSCLQVEPERTVVSLRGHDFTGLGFNICGNMRDGILVKDVLHRGPASESGLIKAGDKIISVTVSFTNIVYEDALTILSYASPYNVQLELERVPDKTRALPNTPSGTKRPLGSCSFNRSGQKLFHPLYRSQSIDDLTQIDRDSSLPPTLGLGPRRSQSVGVAAHKLAAHFKNSDSKLTDDKTDRGVLSSNQMLSTTGSLNEKMLANVMADGSPHWKKRFEDTLDGDTADVVDKSSSEQKKDSIQDAEKKSSDGSTSQTYMKKNMKYLDSPHNKGKLQTYKSPVDKDRDVGSQKAEHSRRAKTMAEASSALWQLDQSIQDGEGSDIESSKSANWNPDGGMGSKSGRFAQKEDENESDVSHDSLELSSKKTSGRKSKKHTSGSLSRDCENETSEDMKQNGSSSAHKQNYQQKSSKKSSHHTENNKSKGHVTEMGPKNEYSRNAERVYANNILNKAGVQNSTDYSGRSKEDPKTVPDAKEAKGSDSVPSVVYANHREMQEKVVVVGRAAQKTVSNEHANNYGKVNGRAAGYSERQKLSGAENFSPNYGSSRIVINGETDDIKNRFASNSKSNYPNHSRDSPSNYPKQDGIKSDEVMRWMENKHKSNLNQKLSKSSSASPAGMFTQINPFQQPSRHKNANFKVWSGREELSANGNDSQYTSSLSNSYGSDSPIQTSRRENMSENQPYVSKTVLISPYETSSRNGVPNSSQILSYRQQH